MFSLPWRGEEGTATTYRKSVRFKALGVELMRWRSKVECPEEYIAAVGVS